MNVGQAEKYVSSLLRFGVNLGLERVDRYLKDRNYPWERIRFIHVGGTNGKGSTSAMIAGILRQSGCRVGLYSSPHIKSYCERISVNGKNIHEEHFAELVAEIASDMDRVPQEDRLTEFEFLTVLALEYFRREGVDAAVMEVGMGGRFDATNVIPRSEVTVITNVSKDHMEYLGSSEKGIAFEKAGIIKPGGSLVSFEESPSIREVFRNRCMEVGAYFHFAGDEVECEQAEVFLSHGIPYQECSIKSSAFDMEHLHLKMLGMHQIKNAATAILAAQILLKKGFEISPRHVRKGLESVTLPGRFEVLHRNPMVVLDAAHNLAGITALKETVSQVAGGRKLVLVTGMLDDKEQDKIAQSWDGLPDWVVVTRPDSARTVFWKQLASLFERNRDNVYLIEDIQEAVACGWNLAGEDGMLCVAGSFYLLNSARQKLQILIRRG